MDDEILKSTALRSLDDFDWLSTADKVFCKANVASGGKAKRISPNLMRLDSAALRRPPSTKS